MKNSNTSTYKKYMWENMSASCNGWAYWSLLAQLRTSNNQRIFLTTVPDWSQSYLQLLAESKSLVQPNIKIQLWTNEILLSLGFSLP